MFVDAIIGGEDVNNPHDYPWMVEVVSYEVEHFVLNGINFTNPKNIGSCGGAIISKNIILTAAHCVNKGWSEFNKGSEPIKKLSIFVRVGNPWLIHSIRVKVKSKIIHPNYFTYAYKNSKYRVTRVNNYDIALLELSEDLNFNKTIQPIALPDEDFDETNYLDKSTSKFMVAGWGVGFDIPTGFYDRKIGTVYPIPKEKYLKVCGVQNSKKYNLSCEHDIKLFTPEVLKVIQVDYIKLGKNSNDLQKKKMPFQIHAMSRLPYIPGPCHGDSGSPLMKLDVTSGKYEVVGIVSQSDEKGGMGPKGCLGPMPDIYTRVSAFVPWIKESMAKASNPESFMQLYQGYAKVFVDEYFFYNFFP